MQFSRKSQSIQKYRKKTKNSQEERNVRNLKLLQLHIFSFVTKLLFSCIPSESVFLQMNRLVNHHKNCGAIEFVFIFLAPNCYSIGGMCSMHTEINYSAEGRTVK